MNYSQKFENNDLDGWDNPQASPRILKDGHNHYIAPAKLEVDTSLFFYKTFTPAVPPGTLIEMKFKIKVPEGEKVTQLACGLMKTTTRVDFPNMPKSDGKWHEYKGEFTADASDANIFFISATHENAQMKDIETGVDEIFITST
ncbi:hypothetical protein J3P95_15490 [Pseudomonas sp. Z5-35]|uniref:hypothetical protein n=1 Tax=unclassified Pseudomonas TaxID=196821 RepID=UPI003DA9633B